ncbi:MAG TPA: VWA domain-containing protein [Ramlibacter sp.]|nr:VWA domain-containing protein [Ramlibacter sp.]
MLNFMWPGMLWMALALPLLVGGYLWLLQRRKRLVVDYPGLSLVRRAAGGNDWRRRIPPALMLLALSSLVLAAARPLAFVTLPTDQKTLMLVMDVSGSMMATDVKPDRLRASQAAAKAFVQELPRSTRIGVVAYGGTAHLVQAPTHSREDVVTAIDRFQLQPGTAIGSGLAAGLGALFPDEKFDLLGARAAGKRIRPVQGMDPLGLDEDPRQKAVASAGPVEPGSYASAAIVLLTDGQNTTGVDPMEAAQVAAGKGVKVFTVGFGTREGDTIDFQGWSMRVKLDEDTLKQIAGVTRGQYFHAGSGQDLSKVYEALKSRLVMEKRETEITVVFALLAGLLMMVAAGLSMWWYGRVA